MTHNPTTRYRHRSAEVEARQWTGHNADQMRAFVGADFGMGLPGFSVQYRES